MHSASALLILLAILTACSSAAPSTRQRDHVYNESEALLAYQYAKIAVCDLVDILAFNCSACGNRTAGFFTSWAIESDSFDVQVFVGFDAPRNMIVVAFRGSKTLANWINDMRFAHVDTPFPSCSGCFLHKGFITSYDSIAVPLFVAVGQLRSQYNTSRIMVTGHSLGGALAQLAALDLTLHDQFAPLSPSLYTFGSPRIGNNNFQLYMQTKIFGWRVVNQHDLVPQVSDAELRRCARVTRDCSAAAAGQGQAALRLPPRTARSLARDRFSCHRKHALAHDSHWQVHKRHGSGVRLERGGPHVPRLAQGEAAAPPGPRQLLQHE